MEDVTKKPIKTMLKGKSYDVMSYVQNRRGERDVLGIYWG
jgi:hypothetical protein